MPSRLLLARRADPITGLCGSTAPVRRGFAVIVIVRRSSTMDDCSPHGCPSPQTGFVLSVVRPAGVDPRLNPSPLSSPGSCHPARAAAARCKVSRRQCARRPGRARLMSARVLPARRGARRLAGGVCTCGGPTAPGTGRCGTAPWRFPTGRTAGSAEVGASLPLVSPTSVAVDDSDRCQYCHQVGEARGRLGHHNDDASNQERADDQHDETQWLGRGGRASRLRYSHQRPPDRDSSRGMCLLAEHDRPLPPRRGLSLWNLLPRRLRVSTS